jgi:hypothetical protein
MAPAAFQTRGARVLASATNDENWDVPSLTARTRLGLVHFADPSMECPGAALPVSANRIEVHTNDTYTPTQRVILHDAVHHQLDVGRTLGHSPG